MAKAIHSMIRVLEEVRSVEFYRTAFGLEVADRLDFENFTLVYLRNAEADFEVELTVNKGREEPYDLCDGYYHSMPFECAFDSSVGRAVDCRDKFGHP